MRAKTFILLLIAASLAVVTAAVPGVAHTPADKLEAASTELIEAQNRERLREQRQVLPRAIPAELHAMVNRETRRARRAILIVVVAGVAGVLLFVLPSSEREQAASDSAEDKGTSAHHRV